LNFLDFFVFVFDSFFPVSIHLRMEQNISAVPVDIVVVAGLDGRLDLENPTTPLLLPLAEAKTEYQIRFRLSISS
jgi:hypothetical protein